MDARRRKLKFRAWRRGFREMDLLMGSFADQHLDQYGETELDQFEALLNLPDWEVYAWLVGQAASRSKTWSLFLGRLNSPK